MGMKDDLGAQIRLWDLPQNGRSGGTIFHMYVTVHVLHHLADAPFAFDAHEFLFLHDPGTNDDLNGG